MDIWTIRINEFVSRNYFMVRGEHSAHSVFSWFYSTSYSFQVFDLPNDSLRGWIPPIIFVSPQWFTLIAVLLRLSVLFHLLVSSLSSPDISMSVWFCWAWDYLSTLHWEFGLTSPKYKTIVRYSEFDPIFFCSAVDILL